MALSQFLTPLGMILEIVIVLLGIYAGYVQKKRFGYLFAVTFLFFAAYDYAGLTGFSADLLSVLNIIAILAAVAGMYLAVRKAGS
jgi:hypothetical protein